MHRTGAVRRHRLAVVMGLLAVLLQPVRPPCHAAILDAVDTFLIDAETRCTNPNEFECNPNGSGASAGEAPICIDASSVCDDARDCPNGSDELDCDYVGCKSPSFFRCHSGKCIVSAFRCDGQYDCPHNDDEDHCDGFVAHHEVTECTADQFRCAADALCIARGYECDGVSHCLDGSDEHAGCASVADALRRCEGGFLCKNNHCLSDTRWRCDGENDCGDGSDELGCTANCMVELGRFLCADNRTCLPLPASVCNGVTDCPAGDDEGGSCLVYANRTCASEQCPAAARCVVLPSGPRCLCKPGFAYNATARVCQDVDECAEYGRCTQGCTNTNGSFRCTCAERFRLRQDGRTCTISRSAGRSDAVLVFAGATSVMALQLGNELHQFQVSNLTDHVVGVSFDGRFVYWTDIATSSESIVRARLDGSAYEVILTSGLAAPEDIAVDWVTGNLYLTDRTYQHIAVCSNDGLHCASLVSANIEMPRSIVLVPQRGEMYWSDWSDQRPMIGRSAMDGRDAIAFVTENLKWPSGVTVDWPNERVYWVDAKLLQIESIGMDGRGRRIVLDRVLKHPHGIAVFENSIYWSDWKTQSVQRCDKFTCKHRETVAKDRVIYDIHIYHKALQPKRPNPCESMPCSHLCLLAAGGSRGTFTCACPAGWMLDADQRKCSPAYKQQQLLVGVGNYLVELHHRSFGRQVAGESKTFGMHIDRLALNTLTGEVFVASNVEHAIYMVNLETLRTKLLVSSNVGEVSALAFDHLGNNLFWTDKERGTIEVLSLHSHRQAIVHHYMGTDQPIALAVMPERAQLMVAVRNDIGHTHFARLSMSGLGDHHQVMDTGIGMDGIQFVIDPETELVYWLDSEFQKIMFTDYDFAMNHSFVNDLDHPTAMAILEEDVFWTTEHSSRIYWAPKNRPNDIKRLVLEVPPFQWKKTNEVMHLMALRPNHTTTEHPCHTHDECSDICVPDTGVAQYVCLCPPGMVFKDRSNRTCLDVVDCELRCRSSGECLAQSRKCDGRKDCVDGSDETDCGTTEPRPVICSNDEFRCTDGSRCIARDLLCDQHNDCADQSDEADCGHYNRTTRCRSGQFQCAEGRCIDANARCDTVRDCVNGDDETNCGEADVQQPNSSVVQQSSRCDAHAEFRCGATGQCVPLAFRCDGLADCADGTDEHRCPVHRCSERQFQCAFGQCIDRRLVCDGHNHCGDNSDEIACGNGPTDKQADIVCGEVDAETKQRTMYQCASNRTLCLPMRAHCNGTAECPRGEDEAGCGECQLNQFECSNKRCVRVEWRCDGMDDCGDGSDELNCATSAKAGGQVAAECDRAHSFDCGDGTCIDLGRVCDGHRDCVSGSDEGGLCTAPCGPDVCQQQCRRMPAGPVCSCRDGYTLSGNRRQCVDVDECRERDPCAQRCDNTEGSFYCSCFVDYVLHTDKRSCRAVERRKYMLFSSFDTIYNVTARTLDLLWSSNGTRIAGMDVDVAAGRLYFTMYDSSALYEYDFGTRLIQYIPNVGAPRRLAVDWSTNNVYFVDESFTPTMRICHMHERVCAQLFHFNYRDIVKALQVDALNGRLFYAVLQFAESLSPQSVVYSHALDGSRSRVLVKDAAHITALECEPRKRLLYFAELATATVWSVGYEGGPKRRLLGPGEPAITRPTALMVSEDELYVFNVGTTVAGHCKVYGDHKCKTFDIAVYNAENLVVMHAPSQKRVVNVCDGHRCSAICVPAQRGPKCLCHGGTVVDAGTACTDGGKTDRRLYDADRTAGAPTAKTGGGMAAKVFGILGWCVLLVAIGGLLYWTYTRTQFRRKFVATVHFQNPRTTTLDTAADGFRGSHKIGAPEMCRTRRCNEIFLNDLSTEEMCDATTPPPLAETGSGGQRQDIGYDDDRLTTKLIGKD